MADCLNSVKGQTYPEIEHVLQDGGSTDGTVDMLDRFSALYNLTWRTEPDTGQSDALNKALRRSSGDIIGWVNADDGYPSAKAVAHAVEAFQRNPGVGVVYGHGLLIDRRGRIIRILPAAQWRSGLLAERCFLYQPTVFIRRAVLEDHGFVRTELNIGMDYDLWLRLLREGVDFLRLDHFQGIDRHHSLRKVETERGRMKAEMNEIRPRPTLKRRFTSRLTDIHLRLSGTALISRLSTEQLFPFLQRPGSQIMMLQQVALPRRFTS